MSVLISTGDVRSSLPFLSATNHANAELLLAVQLSSLRSASASLSHAKKKLPLCNEEELKRDCLEVTGKVFLGRNAEPAHIRESLDALLQEIGSEVIDTFIISLPHDFNRDFRVLWHEMEMMAIEGKVQSIGVSDFGVDELEELFSYAKVQPKVNQIHLEASNPTLLTFAKQHGLDLLTHPASDGSVDIDSMELGSILPKHSDSTSTNTKTDWAVRYDVSIRCRSLLAKKGFLLRYTPL